MREAIDNIVQSGTTDQMRGYANEAMGKTKLTLGLATQSTHLTLTGLAQIVVGEFQKTLGEAKLAEDGKDIFPEL
ncbi:MAG: CsbD family protein [Methylocystis sp.]|nr:CsbD family protein [Methylocystis sp.]MBI5313507.1 CsbD family protein [Methylocystis sp.]